KLPLELPVASLQTATEFFLRLSSFCSRCAPLGGPRASPRNFLSNFLSLRSKPLQSHSPLPILLLLTRAVQHASRLHREWPALLSLRSKPLQSHSPLPIPLPLTRAVQRASRRRSEIAAPCLFHHWVACDSGWGRKTAGPH